MKNLKFGLLAFGMWIAGISVSAAQTNSTEQPIHIPDGYYQEQGQAASTEGVASISIDGEQMAESESSTSSWESGGTETLRVSSGKHEGNNVVRKIKIQLPEGSTSAYDDYNPH